MVLGWQTRLQAKGATPAPLWEQDLRDGGGADGHFAASLASDHWVFPSYSL